MYFFLRTLLLLLLLLPSFIFSQSSGCTDSLACNYNPLATINDSSCNYNSASYDTLSINASIVWNGMTLTVSGDYSVTLTNSVGCDSVVNLNLTINPTGLLNITNTEKTLLKITDILGREIHKMSGQSLSAKKQRFKTKIIFAS